MRIRLACALLAVATGAGCGDEERPPTPFTDAGPRCMDVYDPPATPGDADGDGVPNDEDDDADGDGFDNAYEHAGGPECVGEDPDADGTASWLDMDSDGDGLSDAREKDVGSNPYAGDTDGDGVSDLLEVGLGTSPRDPASKLDSSWTTVVLRPGEDVSVEIRFVNEVEIADVVFLIDVTGSMGGELDNLKSGLTRTIVPGIQDAFRDVRFGAAGLADYPVGSFGGDFDRPFFLRTAMISGDEDSRTWVAGMGFTAAANDRPDILDAIDTLNLQEGGDIPESFVPALYATATGRGLLWPGGMVDPQESCGFATFGYPCFREEAFPIILLIGDAPFHNGPADSAESFPYGDMVPEAPLYDAARMELVSAGIRVVGIYTGPTEGMDSGRDHFRQLARDTLAVDAAGAPLVFELPGDGSGLDSTVVTAIRQLASGRRQDITANATGAERDGFEPTTLVQSLVAVEGYVDGTAGANPGVSYESKDGATFRQVEPGVELEYALVLRNDVSDLTSAEAYALTVRAVGAGGATFAIRRFAVIVVPDGWEITTEI